MDPIVLPDIDIDMIIGHRHFHVAGPTDGGQQQITDAINWLIEQYRLHYGLYGFRIRGF